MHQTEHYICAVREKLMLCALFLLAGLINGFSQDNKVTLSPTMYEKYRQEILICDLEGWLFREGNDTSWAKKEIDTKGWRKLKPTQLNAGMANEEGRVEGWFRLNIKLSDTFKDSQFSFQATRWAAIDLYLDGNHLASFGNTGQGNNYKENQEITVKPVNVQLNPGSDHVITIHLVDYVSPIRANVLKTEDLGGLNKLLRLTGPDYFVTNIVYLLGLYKYLITWISVCFLLSILFWLLFFQNRQEKNLMLIALAMSSFTLNVIIIYNSEGSGNRSFLEYSELRIIQNLALGAFHIFLLLFIIKIFNRKVTSLLKLFLVLYFILLFTDSILFSAGYQFLLGIAMYGLFLFFIISSWKNLKGAQWAILAGQLFTLGFSIMYAINFYQYKQIIFPYAMFYATGAYLSFPISLLVYVAMRFREIIREVRSNAQQVIKLSEEKKEQALNQKKVLEEEVARQTIALRQSLEDLKATQSQLIHSEKMASLGELTTGIAHEIQNPLNFVNNFSELNKELLLELNQSIQKGDMDEAKSITKDIIDNEERIIFHGSRADSIVKSMLQHSRKGSGQKELTDINTLCDDFLRLAYHGQCAKNKSFRAKFETHFSPTIPKLNIEPQDIGRVLLNLINNAFYAVHEKSNQSANGYDPTVVVRTQLVSNSTSGTNPSNQRVKISVEDNGSGIPETIKDKIFQPFFTTKPTGEGTGLGLSLSYDIIKAHGGTIELSSRPGMGTEFTVWLPAAE